MIMVFIAIQECEYLEDGYHILGLFTSKRKAQNRILKEEPDIKKKHDDMFESIKYCYYIEEMKVQ